ncbi:MAG TPA: right-handed parallel beta-helix repeat-containing protein [Acidimicrobiales bacterium]|nr:right-handed parallel beta-helix repeat-containing protein [Acidimicrobiales bacterium]
MPPLVRGRVVRRVAVPAAAVLGVTLALAPSLALPLARPATAQVAPASRAAGGLSPWLPAPLTSFSPHGQPVPAEAPRICGDTALLDGPKAPPPGAIVVRAGDDSASLGRSWQLRAGRTYWFAPGTHLLGPGQYSQVQPKPGDTFIGAPGAVIDGQHKNNSAFDGQAPGVTIEYLTIENFATPNGQNAVNHDNAAGWTVRFNTVKGIWAPGHVKGPDYPGGAALGMGDDDLYEYNCLTGNGEYGLNASGSSTLFAYNEVSYNGRADFPDQYGCGCSGGIKYWATENPTVEGNYIHDNYNVGLWFDTDNTGALVTGNVISANWAEGIIYEISYNADITSNVFVANGWGNGSSYAGGFPYGDGIYVNGSAGLYGIPGSDFEGHLDIHANTFDDNWDGVIVYQNPDRLCGTNANSSTGYCTLDDPAVFDPKSCGAWAATSRPSRRPDYFDACQWKANNVAVTANRFQFDPHRIDRARPQLLGEHPSRCYGGANALDTEDAPPRGNRYWCGFNGMFAAAGTAAPLRGYVVANAMMGKRDPSGERPDHNDWRDNTYCGPWVFQAYVQGASPVSTNLYPRGVRTTLTLQGWQSIWRQDAGSRQLAGGC